MVLDILLPVLILTGIAILFGILIAVCSIKFQGFLIFENGITLFGIGMMKEHTILIELGILLDVLVLVMIMGIAICQISRKFEHIDADKLNRLDDLPEKEAE